MKPIKLKIKGLNSFIETQEINFEELIKRGLFGIFGPTGSGKSTILDGITLALYGEIARKSTNFMNTNCDSLNVSYEFQIREKNTKKYRVDREFRRDNKNGSIKSKSARVIDITDGNEVILEEGARLVTQKCEEIIGLKLEDFTRTVVLPQGKFSEFLKLEGKARRDMLERLFNLQKYGDDLSFKLGNKIKIEKQKSDFLDGELKNYEEISHEVLKNKKVSLNEIKGQLIRCQDDLSIAEKNYNEGKELWNLQSEIKEKLEYKNKLEENEERIKEIKKRADFGTSILKVKPYIDSYENTAQQIDVVKTELVLLKENLANIKIEKDNNIKLLEKCQGKKDNEIPLLKIKEQKILDAIEEKFILDKLRNEINILRSDISKLNERFEATRDKYNLNENNIKLLNNEINEFEYKIDTLKTDEEYKKKINEGIILLNKYNNSLEEEKKLSKEIENIIISIDENKEKSQFLSCNLRKFENTLQKKEVELKNLIENCPGDENTLLQMHERLTKIKDKWDRYNEYSLFINNSKDNILKLNKELKDFEEEKLIIEENIGNLKDNIKKIERENISMQLRAELKEGQSCPVCGSTHHKLENIEKIDLSNLEKLRSELSLKEEKYISLNDTISKLQAKIESERVNLKDKEVKLIELGDEFKDYSIGDIQKEFEKAKLDINNYNLLKVKLENEIKSLNEERNTLNIEYNRINTLLMQSKEYLEKLGQDLKIKNEGLNKINKDLSDLKEELLVDDFKKASEEIFEKEKEKSALEARMKKKREDLIKVQKYKDELNLVLANLKEELREKNALFKEKSINIEEKNNSIKAKVGEEEDLEKLKNYVVSSINEIESQYAKVFNQSKEIEKQFNELSDKINAFQGNLNSLSLRLIQDKEALNKVLREENIDNINYAKENFLPQNKIDEMLLKVEEYNNEHIKISASIENLSIKINNRYLTEKEWQEIQNKRNEKLNELEVLKENKIKLEEEVKIIGEKLIYKKDLLDKKKDLDYKLSILSDLEKLFKGKKFVEFVATNQLKYVSIEACKRLKEITSGQYGLEVDENGKFLIIDYKNGGAKRDASTLSGGETFLASLSLALALSAQIQLKGTAPLELFFLDEGFGTLDDNLLEVVMDSLEKIHNNKLSIGIISHVKAIKNRVPIKLIVSPAISGMGGSKVRIDI